MITKQKLNNFYHEHKEVFALNIGFSLLLCVAVIITYSALWFTQQPKSITQILLTAIAIQIGVNMVFVVAIGVVKLIDLMLED